MATTTIILDTTRDITALVPQRIRTESIADSGRGRQESTGSRISGQVMQCPLLAIAGLLAAEGAGGRLRRLTGQ
jgi:hypothetical protein